MKTVLVGIGKCGSRMVFDLNAFVYEGTYSPQIHGDGKTVPVKKKGIFNFSWLNRKNEALVKNIRPDDMPAMHMGDPDNQNEIIEACRRVPEGEEEPENYRQKLAKNIISFPNYSEACGQYHIIGEQVMLNLLERDDTIRDSLILPYINTSESKDKASVYMLAFSAGGGTGCGVSTVLASEIASAAKSTGTNMLVAGLTALPGRRESKNYKISAGRFLTKFLSSEQGTSFDTIFTVSNSIIQKLDIDDAEIFCRVNVFAARLLLSLINSSSKYNRCPVNTDGPELRKNLHGLSFFCYAQADPSDTGMLTDMLRNTSPDTGMLTLDMLRKALGPLTSTTKDKDKDKDSKDGFYGSSICFDFQGKYTLDQWTAMCTKIQEFKDDMESWECVRDEEILRSKVNELFPDMKALPLPLRTAQEVVVLRGIPKKSKNTSWEQTVLVTLLQVLFPKARIHYYYTYHLADQNTLTLIPSNYICYETLELIKEYLQGVWEMPQDGQKMIGTMLTSTDADVSLDQVSALFGPREHFEKSYNDFHDILDRTSTNFSFSEDSRNEMFIKDTDLARMFARVQDIISILKRKSINDSSEFLDALEDL